MKVGEVWTDATSLILSSALRPSLVLVVQDDPSAYNRFTLLDLETGATSQASEAVHAHPLWRRLLP